MAIQIIISIVKFEIADDENITKDLEQFATGIVKKFEKLQVLK